MKTSLKVGIAALTLAGFATAAVVPADAASFRGGHSSRGHVSGGHVSRGYSYRGYDHRGNAGLAIGAGVAGLALGAALADGHRGYGYGYGYAPYDYGYDYGPGYGYADPYYYGARECVRDVRSYDRWGRPVIVPQRFAC